MDAISIVVIFIVLLIVALSLKKASNVIIVFGLIDIFLRIMNYIGEHTVEAVNDIINKVLPNSIPAIINSNSSGILCDILMWGYIVLMILFVYYVFRTLLKRL
jgi:hypothetical protein